MPTGMATLRLAISTAAGIQLPVTRRQVALCREWDSLGESTEDGFIDRLDMWAVGIAFVVVGASIWVGEWTTRRPRREF